MGNEEALLLRVEIRGGQVSGAALNGGHELKGQLELLNLYNDNNIEYSETFELQKRKRRDDEELVKSSQVRKGKENADGEKGGSASPFLGLMPSAPSLSVSFTSFTPEAAVRELEEGRDETKWRSEKMREA